MRNGDWMQTASGRQFWPLDPRPEEIHLEDIAHALSMQCRYAGHCRLFYSVAEHSTLVSRMVPTLTAQRWGLLHDASEAYLVDVPRPVKPHLVGYAAAEKTLLKALAERFDLPWPMPDVVKMADDSILADEKAQIMPPSPEGEEWHLPQEESGVTVMGLWPDRARERFLERAQQLGIA